MTKTCRREGTIGTRNPSIAATVADHGPAQMTVCAPSISRAAVRTPVTVPRVREAVRDLVRSRETVTRAEGGSAQVVRPQSRHHGPRLGRLELDDVLQAHPPLQLDRRLEALALLLGGEQEEVTDRTEVGGMPGFFDEAGQQAFGLHSHPDVDLGGELGADAACARRRRALADPSPVDHDHP